MDTALQLDIVQALAAAGGRMSVSDLADAIAAVDMVLQRDMINAVRELLEHGSVTSAGGVVSLTQAGTMWVDGLADRRVPLEVAEGIARQLVADLEYIQGVIRLEIAGSIRRRKETVGDIELVALVDAAQDDLFGGPSSAPSMGLTSALRKRADTVLCTGPSMTRVVVEEPEHGQVKVDLFQTCDPKAWGMLFFIRTGSADFVRRALAYWKQCTNGGECSGLRLRIPGGRAVDTPQEEDVFRVISEHAAAAGLRPVPFVPPERRAPRE